MISAALISSLPRGTYFVPNEVGDASLTPPAGLGADVFASGLNAPQVMTVGPGGAPLVSERRSGTIVALRDPGQSDDAREGTVLASGVELPTRVDYVGGKLYLGETSRHTQPARPRTAHDPNCAGGFRWQPLHRRRLKVQRQQRERRAPLSLPAGWQRRATLRQRPAHRGWVGAESLEQTGLGYQQPTRPDGRRHPAGDGQHALAWRGL
jgi:hypothetical protein